MLSRSGYLVKACPPEIRKELTVRPIVNGEYGARPPSFKVYRDSKGYTCMPKYYGIEKFGQPTEDRRPDPAKMTRGVVFKGKLRDETSQNEAFAKAISAGHGVLSLPCGYGKTTVALAIAAHLGLRTMIVVHKEFLANQWRERIQQFCPGATIGVVQQNRLETNCDFVIAMLQSLSLKEYSHDAFESIGTIVVDEAHHICAQVFSQSMFKLCPRHCYALSATPDRKDGLTKVLHWFFGPTFFAIQRENQEQVEVFVEDFTCRRFKDPPPVTRFGKISLATMITDLTEIDTRNLAILKLIKRLLTTTNRKILVLTDRRAHCIFLQSKFPKKSGLYMGGMKEADLEESSTRRLIIGTFSQAHEGLDIPTLDTVILATPKSDIQQSIGRVMRETPGKQNNPWIFDILDHWSVFNAMFYKRRQVYKKGGFRIDAVAQEDEEVNELFKGKCLL